MLLRKFIGQRLASYYAQSADSVVSSSLSSDPINFRWLLGERHWKRTLDRMYREQKGQWFTPVELFKPYYSNSIANFIAKHSPRVQNSDRGASDDDDSTLIDIVEVGGGRATNALAILDHLEKQHPEVYHRIRYTMVDSSPTLHKLQQEQIKNSNHTQKVSFVQKDLTAVAEGTTTLISSHSRTNEHNNPRIHNQNRVTFVIALEVFDNLPHDKVKSFGNNQRLQQAAVQQSSTDGTWNEVFEPLNDPLLTRVLQVSPSYARHPVTWVPTVALGLLHDLPQWRPKVQLLVADFDWFPDPQAWLHKTNSSPSQPPPPRRSRKGQEEPLIKSMESDYGDNGELQQQEYECYLTAPPLADILFPTHFGRLSQFLQRAWKRKPERKIVVDKQGDFLQQYGGSEQVRPTTSWVSGYSPMLHDYSNTSILTATLVEQ